MLPGWLGLSDDDRLRGWLDRQFRSFLDLSRTPSRERRYAVRHQSFRDLFDPAGPEDDRDDGTRHALHHAVTAAHRRISAELLAAVRAEFPHGSVDDYTRAELADHVTAAEMLDEESTDPTFLLACDPSSLLRLRPAATTSQAHSALAAYELSLGHHDSDAGLWWLHVWARKTRCHRLADRATEWLGQSWTVTAAMWSGTNHRSLTGHTDWVTAVCAVPLADGRTLLASASNDETVRLWDPATGQQIGPPLTGHTGGVDAVCAVPLADGRTLLASASADETVRLWDPATGQQIDPPLTGHTGGVYSVWTVCAVPLADGRTLLASASHDRAVLVWKPAADLMTNEFEFRMRH